MRRAVARAPATVANVAVGFDVLGFALDAVADRVTVARDDGGAVVVVEAVDGAVDGAAEVPLDAERNTAAVALAALIDGLDLGFGFRVRIVKGIPAGSGLGSSAASAAGAVVAANALLDEPLATERLLPYAVAGEAAASGAAHADNVAPCLFGGLCAVLSDPLDVVSLPVPDGVRCVVARPRIAVATRDARSALGASVALAGHAAQSARLAAFVAACFRGDLELLGRALRDELIEPQRAGLIPGFADAQRAALAAGALGCSIAGSGPSVFGLVREGDGAAVEAALRGAFHERGVDVEAFVAGIAREGAMVVES